jgi:hypothetical protein
MGNEVTEIPTTMIKYTLLNGIDVGLEICERCADDVAAGWQGSSPAA